MERIRTTWRSGRRGQAIVGCGALLLTCVVCTVIAQLTPRNQQAAAPGNGSQPVAARATNTARPEQPTEPPRATNTVGPTATPEPTETPAPTDTPATTLSPVDSLQTAILEAIGEKNNRDLDKLTTLEVTQFEPPIINIWFALDDNFSSNLIRVGALMDIENMLKAIDDSGMEYESVSIIGTFALSDQFGNSSESPVIRSRFTRETVDKINWDGFSRRNLPDIADDWWEHPAIQE